jgi:hypothetical protein
LDDFSLLISNTFFEEVEVGQGWDGFVGGAGGRGRGGGRGSWGDILSFQWKEVMLYEYHTNRE